MPMNKLPHKQTVPHFPALRRLGFPAMSSYCSVTCLMAAHLNECNLYDRLVSSRAISLESIDDKEMLAFFPRLLNPHLLPLFRLFRVFFQKERR